MHMCKQLVDDTKQIKIYWSVLVWRKYKDNIFYQLQFMNLKLSAMIKLSL